MEHDVKISIELTHGEDEVLLKFLERILADDVSSTRDNFRADVSLFNMPSARPSVALETELAKTEIEKGTDGEAGQDLAGFMKPVQFQAGVADQFVSLRVNLVVLHTPGTTI